MLEIPSNISDIVRYDASSPTKLVWNDVRLCGNGDKLTVIGEQAGFVSGRYYKIEIYGVSYQTHRIVYLLTKGKIPEGYVIDHFNKNSFDNSPENLIAKKQLHNIRNQGKRVNNTSGVTGVKLEKERFGLSYWVAFWNDPDTFKQQFKRFSIKKLGDKEAFKNACEYREKMILSMVKDGYSISHGK